MGKFKSYGLVFMLLILFSSIAEAEQTAFTQEDRERLIKLEAATQENTKELAVLKAITQENSKKLANLEAATQENSKKLAVPEAATQELKAAFQELKATTQENTKELTGLKATLQEFKAILQEFKQSTDKRFDQMFTFLWILAGIFTALTAGTIGFALWDRKTMLKEAKRETIEETKKIVESLDKGKIEQLLLSLKELAKVDTNVAEALKKFNLL